MACFTHLCLVLCQRWRRDSWPCLRVAGCEAKLCVVNLVKTLIRAGYQYQGVDADGKVICGRNLVGGDEKRGDAARQSIKRRAALEIIYLGSNLFGGQNGASSS
jgi:hypothetical protein